MANRVLLAFVLLIGLSHSLGQLESEPPEDLFTKIFTDRDVNENFYLLKSVQKTKKMENYRLPVTIFPETYNITLETLLAGSFDFNGYVEINATVALSTKEIKLHYKNLTIVDYRVYDDKQKELNVSATSYNNVTNIYSLVLNETLVENSSVLIAIKFKGALSEESNGFYRSSYYDAEGNRKWLAATQFEPVYARKAFPCFDEPGFKAKFTMHIRRSKNYTALSNMPLVKTQEYPDTALDTFAESPRMSSYLVAIIISDFESLSLNNSVVKIWAKKTVIKDGNFSLHFGSKVHDAFGQLFNITNQVPKTDMVGVPDFSSGAMENWGLITYREYLVIYDEEENSDAMQQSVGSTIAHELAHMWFGNLLSPIWWEYTWLNEGFANYFQHIGAIMAEPSWQYDGRYVAEAVRPAMFYDSSNYSVSVSHPCSTPSEIKSMFGAITYQKGGSVIRMMRESFGPEVFYGAIRQYLAENKFSNVWSEVLWEAIQKQVDKYKPEIKVPVRKLMSNWINESGHPVLTVKITKDQIHVRQNRFLIGSEPDNKTWYVPITYATEKNPNFTNAETNLWINDDLTIELANASKQWVVFNVKNAGFYRVNYDLRSWYRIIKTLNSKKYATIHEFNRVAIIDDLFNLARAEYIGYDVVLDALQYLQYETNYLAIQAALNGLSFLNNRYSGQEDEELLKNHILNLIHNIYKRHGYHDSKDDSKYTVLLRAELNAVACKLNHSKCISNSVKAFAKWRKEPAKKVPKNQRPTAYCYAIQEGSAEDWEFLHEQYLKTHNVYERLVIFSGLACTRNYTLLERYLFKAMTDYDAENQIHRQDSLGLFNSVARRGYDGAKYMLHFLAKYQDKVAKFYKDNSTVVQLFLIASRSFTTQERIDEFQNYIDENVSVFKPILTYLERIKLNALYEMKWYNKHSASISAWLYKNYP